MTLKRTLLLSVAGLMVSPGLVHAAPAASKDAAEAGDASPKALPAAPAEELVHASASTRP